MQFMDAAPDPIPMADVHPDSDSDDDDGEPRAAANTLGVAPDTMGVASDRGVEHNVDSYAPVADSAVELDMSLFPDKMDDLPAYNGTEATMSGLRFLSYELLDYDTAQRRCPDASWTSITERSRRGQIAALQAVHQHIELMQGQVAGLGIRAQVAYDDDLVYRCHVMPPRLSVCAPCPRPIVRVRPSGARCVPAPAPRPRARRAPAPAPRAAHRDSLPMQW